MSKNNYISLLLLLFISCTNTAKEDTTIGIQIYNGFNETLADTIAKALKKTYQAKTVLLPKKQIPENAFVNIKTPRYRADLLLIDLKTNKPDTLHYVLGLTHYDISTTKKDDNGNIKKPVSKYADWGVFGLGYRPGPSCIISSHRIQSKDRQLFISRLIKVCIHEVGHNLGLEHCLSQKCVMQDAAESIHTVDMINPELCIQCKNKLKK